MPGASLFRRDGDRLRPGLHAILFLLITLFLFKLAASALLLLPIAIPAGSSLVWLGVWRAIQLVIVLAVSRFMLAFLDRRSFRTLGLWNYPAFGRELGIGIALGAVAVAVGAILLLASRKVVIVAWADNWRETSLSALVGFLVVVAAAAWEETLFRGYPFQRLVEALGPVSSVAIFSTFFGLLHKTNPEATPLSLVNTVLAGTLLAVAYLKTRGLWLPLGFHVAWNYVQGYVFSLPVSGVRVPYPAAVLVWRPPVWQSGGNYGPEGSVVITLVFAVAVLWLIRTRRLSPSAAMKEVLK